MPGPIQKIWDPNTGGGVIIFTPNFTVFANGLPVATSFSTVTPHFSCPKNPIHCAAKTTGLGGISGRVFVGGLPVSVNGDVDTCGHRRIGFSTVFVG